MKQQNKRKAWQKICEYEGIAFYNCRSFTETRLYLVKNGHTIDHISYNRHRKDKRDKQKAIEIAKNRIEKYGYHE